MSWAWMKDSNHFSGLTSAFRAAYEQSNLKVGLISAFDRHTSLKVGLILAFDQHTSINRSISADHALAHTLESGGEGRNLKKVSSLHYLTMYLNSFVPKTKHNYCGCISQVCIYKGIFRFWSALCGLLGDKCSIASSCLVHKTSPVHMAFSNSLREAKQLLWEANNPRNGAKQILRDSKHLLRETNKPSNGAIQIQTLGKVTENLLWETIFRYNVINSHNIAFNGIQSENFVDKTCAITRNLRQASHILAMYMIKNFLRINSF